MPPQINATLTAALDTAEDPPESRWSGRARAYENADAVWIDRGAAEVEIGDRIELAGGIVRLVTDIDSPHLAGIPNDTKLVTHLWFERVASLREQGDEVVGDVPMTIDPTDDEQVADRSLQYTHDGIAPKAFYDDLADRKQNRHLLLDGERFHIIRAKLVKAQGVASHVELRLRRNA